MRKLILLTLIIAFAYISQAQDHKASQLLEKYGFTTEHVLNGLDLSNSTYSFSSTITTNTYTASTNSNFKDVRTYSFDAKKEKGAQFTLLSVNDTVPTKSDIKHFNKQHNSSSKQKKVILKQEDFFVKSNDDATAVIGFNMPKDELPSKFAYMAHSTGFIYIDKKSGRITKIEIKSNEAFSMKIFHVTEMLIQIKFAYNEEHKQYYIISENTKMKILMLGAIAESKIEEVFSEFKFY